jgi:hypothetical protein
MCDQLAEQRVNFLVVAMSPGGRFVALAQFDAAEAR